MSAPNSSLAARIAAVNLTGLSPAERVQLFFDFFSRANHKGFGKAIEDDLRLVSASAVETVFEFTVKESHTGATGALHVGAAALILDICTSIALATAPNFWQHLGLSRSLNVTYIHPAPMGTEIVIRSTIVHSGKQLATMQGVITDKRDGKIICTGEHLKFNSQPATEKL